MAYLTLDDQKKIASIVENIKMQTGLSYPENDLVEIAKALGIEVYEADFNNNSNIDGLLQYKDENNQPSPKIYINKNRPMYRKKFTLAHEIGHYVLHKNDDIKYRLDDFDYSDDGTTSQQETEANFFAATLLVPEDKLRKILSLSNKNIEIAAKYFGVSKPVIENRIKWIKSNNLNW